ncbi:MAG: GT4 family glycosyltransferase PelF [Clostridiaceae bacterium]|nr:GT4 family glycosyltransferase PelF [Clostridiaceae bacterium]
MKVCIVVEGCYPYVVGGVSSWVHSLILQFPNVEFSILTIAADRSLRGKFVYEIPENVSEIREIYVQDVDWTGPQKRRKPFRLRKKDFQALNSLILNEQIDWNGIFEFFSSVSFSVNDLLMGKDFLLMAEALYKKSYENVTFSDFLWSLRSMYLPLFLCLKTPLPKADLYHCVATGYAGVIGSMAKVLNHAALLISEHGIYSREREEDIIKATWVQGVYKNIWIEHFKKMSTCSYQQANQVTSLFESARALQIELGCPAEKTLVTPNGIDPSRFADIPGKQDGDEKYFNIGAVLRIAPIKDVKTLINAFYYAKQREPSLKLWIMGPWEEGDAYAQEVFSLVETLQPEDLIFTGRINVTEYLGRMDATILSSISEGQPLTILEGFAAKCPAIATNVGNCEGLIYGEGGDSLGSAGIVVDTMSVAGLSDAMVKLARNPEQAKQMGEIGYRRLMEKYQLSQMKATYRSLYRKMAEITGCEWNEASLRRCEEQEKEQTISHADA